MKEKDSTREYVSKKIALRPEIERKGGAVTDVAFLVAVLMGQPDHPRYCNLKDNILDSPELYNTYIGDLCNRIILISRMIGGSEKGDLSRYSTTHGQAAPMPNKVHPLGYNLHAVVSSLVPPFTVNAVTIGRLIGQIRFSSSCHFRPCGKPGLKCFVTRGPRRIHPGHQNDDVNLVRICMQKAKKACMALKGIPLSFSMREPMDGAWMKPQVSPL